MKANNRNITYLCILTVFSYLFFMFGNGVMSLTNPDEVFYAQSVKEMIQHKSWLAPFLFGQPQFEKPIFLFWLLRLSFIVFGISSFSARFFPALFAMVGVIAVYGLAQIGFHDAKKAFLSSLILMSSTLYIGLARFLFTDMVFSIFILLALAAFFWGYSDCRKKTASSILYFVFSALAVLTKGPLGFFIPFLIILTFLFFKRELPYISSRNFLFGLLVFIAISFPWYLYMISKYGQHFIHEFFYNDHIRRLLEAEHPSNDRWYFYPFSVVAGMFPWSLFAIPALFYLGKHLKEDRPIYLFMACWVAVVFLIFEPAHSKLASYILPILPAVALITGDFIHRVAWLENHDQQFFMWSLLSWFIFLFIPVGMIFGLMKYPGYLTSAMPVYIYGLFFMILLSVILFFILRRNTFMVICFLVLLIPSLFFLVPFVHQDIEPYVSSKNVAEGLLKNYSVDYSILCSRAFVRGVRYYTDKEVAVIDLNGRNFFSPHPIPFLNSGQHVKDFLSQQPLTYAIVRKSAAKDIQGILGQEFKMTLLDLRGDAHVLKIEPVLNPKSPS